MISYNSRQNALAIIAARAKTPFVMLITKTQWSINTSLYGPKARKVIIPIPPLRVKSKKTAFSGYFPSSCLMLSSRYNNTIKYLLQKE